MDTYLKRILEISTNTMHALVQSSKNVCVRVGIHSCIVFVVSVFLLKYSFPMCAFLHQICSEVVTSLEQFL